MKKKKLPKKPPKPKQPQPNVTMPVDFVLDNFVDLSLDEKSVSKQIFSETLNCMLDVYMNSQRYILFKFKGCSCVVCGMTATRCELVSGGGNVKRSHWNFIGDLNGVPTVLTKDHIIPLSLGGKDVIENYQPMCMRCNVKKDKRIISVDDLKRELEQCEIEI